MGFQTLKNKGDEVCFPDQSPPKTPQIANRHTKFSQVESMVDIA